MADTILRIACFVTKDADWRNVVEHYARRANELLAPYGLQLGHRYGTGPVVADEIAYAGDCFYKAGDPGSMRHKCHQLWPDGKGIPVIVCNFPSGDGTNGCTVNPEHDDANSGVKWLPYILINARNFVASGSTLLHEMIHTTGLGDAHHDGDPGSIFHAHGTSASSKTLSRKHADRLRKAYYAEAAA
ncbi:MAG TPA: hypothetical protein VGN83_27705 [Falsiroseomonas sp.]|jgi:hypothetical protein|nr:hypothetical protein [Falsiroseomonas sp.]